MLDWNNFQVTQISVKCADVKKQRGFNEFTYCEQILVIKAHVDLLLKNIYNSEYFEA